MWLDTFNQMRKNSQMSLDELSKKSGVPKGTLTKITSGITKSPTLGTMRNLVYAMGYTLKDLDDGLDASDIPSIEEKKILKKYRALDEHGREMVDSALDIEHSRCQAPTATEQEHQRKQAAARMESAEEIEPEPERIIDLLFDELKASAGSGYEPGDDRMQVRKVVYNDLTRKADFCVEVDGRSMEPKFHSGDIILVRNQPAVDVGEIGLFTVDNKGYVKKQGPDRLISINPEEDDVYPGEYDPVFCRGKVLGVLEPEWIIEK